MLDRLAPELQQRVIVPGRPETMLRIKECLERGEIVGMLGDRPFGGEATSACPFLGAPAQFPHGPFRLAMVLETPVVLFFGLYEGGNRYGSSSKRWRDRPASGGARRRGGTLGRALRSTARALRAAAPYNWFNFYDFWQRLALAWPLLLARSGAGSGRAVELPPS